jgi:homocitrate synthase
MSLTEWAIIDTTLREGEQYLTADFSSDDRMEIAEALDEFGVEYIEVTSPRASPLSRADCARLVRRGLRAKIMTNIRLNREDALYALDTGVRALNTFIGASSYSRAFGHGKSVEEIIDLAAEVLTYIHDQAPEVELRFSTEDTFRADLRDIIRIDLAVDQLGLVRRFGVADTVGVATPFQVQQVVSMLVHLTGKEVEFHGHNDTGCAIANSYAALASGATHIDTTVLGIGERNGLTPLEGFIARMYSLDKAVVAKKYRLERLPVLSKLVAAKIGEPIPFNHYLTGSNAFTHKAGIHTNGILRNPLIYEPLEPEVFGRSRTIAIAHRLTGWNAISERARALNLALDKEHLRQATEIIKARADVRRLTIEDVDNILMAFAARLAQEANTL